MISHPWRQGLHLEPPQGWLNDPNGLAYFQHRYHVFFQFCPQSAGGVGAKCWGHYESPDLVHWTYTGAPLQPGGLYDLGDAYSGSAVAQGDTLWLYYTGNYKAPGPHDYIHTGRHHNTIRVAFDGRQCQGRKQLLLSNLDYPRHCTLHVRDPKVWQEGQMWWMVLGARDQADRGEVLLYRSPDGEKWSLERELKKADFGYMWECPDCFCLDGQWLLSVSPQGLPHGETCCQNVYQSGYFPLSAAPLEGELGAFAEWDMGFDFYAPQSFAAPDGRRLLVGWMGMPDATYHNPTVPLGWQHCLTMPRELSWKEGRVYQRPAREMEGLCRLWRALPETVEVKTPVRVQARAKGPARLTLAEGLHLEYDPDQRLFAMTFSDSALGGGRTVRRARLEGETLELDLWVDNSSVECYLNGGHTVFSTRFYPIHTPIRLESQGLEGHYAPLRTLQVEEMQES